MQLQKIQDSIPTKIKEDIPQGVEITKICQGLKVWKNKTNKFCIARLHYSADPRKRTKEWKENARAGMTYAEWMREYEIVGSSFSGIPVYLDDYSREFHVSDEPLEWSRAHPIIRGWDFGLAKEGMACVFVQLLGPFRLFVYKELTASDTDIEHFAPAVKQQSLEWFPGCFKYFDVVDETGVNRNQVDKRSCVGFINKEFKTNCVPGLKSKVKRRKAVGDFLKTNAKGLPKLVLDAEGVSHLIEGFDGGYHYGFNKSGQGKDDPEKNEYSHDHDALQVICSRIMDLDLSGRGTVEIGGPTYNFGR